MKKTKQVTYHNHDFVCVCGVDLREVGVVKCYGLWVDYISRWNKKEFKFKTVKSSKQTSEEMPEEVICPKCEERIDLPDELLDL